MRLLFTGTTSIWLVLFLLIAACVYTILIYRQHALPKPWSFWLPAMRVTSLVLLILTLLQPVISKVWKINVRGKIPIVVDNSGSMSITDTYTPANIVNIGWNFKLFPGSLRNTVFTEELDHIENIDKNLIKLIASKSNPGKHAISELRKQVEKSMKKIASSIKNTDYLQKQKKAPKIRYLNNGVSFRCYENIKSKTLDDFKKVLRSGRQPDKIIPLKTLEMKKNHADNYGGVIKGVLIPQKTREVSFAVAADDFLEFYLSTNENPYNKRLIASVKNWTAHKKFDLNKEQISKPVFLTKGERYYFEIVFKETVGDDSFAIYWITKRKGKPRAIPSKCISDYREKGKPEVFSRSYFALVKSGNDIQNKFKQVENLLKSDKNLKKNVSAARKIMRDISNSLQKQATELSHLQSRADNVLGLSGNKQIIKAAEKLKKMNRTEIVEFLLTQKPFNILKELKKIGDVEIVLMNQPLRAVNDDEKLPEKNFLPTTRLGSVLYDISNRYGKQPISGIFLFSDGQINSGKSLIEIKEIFRERKIPLYSVGIGQKQPPKDICIEKVFAPISSYKDDKLNINVVLHRNGFEDDPFKLTLKCDGKTLKEQRIQPGQDSTITVDMSFLEKKSGLRHYEVVAESKPGEILKNNNSKAFSVNILTDPVKVLLVEEFPRWESRYLNMMLKRDIRINLETIFIASSEDGKLKIEDKKGCFPATRNKMFAYDVIILGDVNPAHFNIEQLKNLRDFVIERGGVLIAMAGPHYMPEAYRDTPIKNIFPCQIKPKQIYQGEEDKENSEIINKVPIVLNELAMYEDMVRIGDTPESTLDLWKGLPEMNWVKSGVYPSKNAEILVRSEKEKLPVLLTAYAGLGKVLYIGTDSFWRWRKYVRWKYHHRMWGQIIMWATLGKTTGADKHVKLMTDRPIYSPDEAITLKARVLDKDEKAMEKATVSAEIYDADGEMVKNVRFISIPNSGGEYRAKVKGLPKGKYKVVPIVLELADVEINADYNFEVKDIATSEYIKLVLNEKNLNSISNEYQFFPMAGKLVDKIPEINKIEEKKKDYDLWDSFYLMFLVAILLAAEWSIRKKIKLV